MTVYQQVVFKSIVSSESPMSGLLAQGKRLGAHALHKGRAGVHASAHQPQSSAHQAQSTLFRKPKPPHKNACGNGAGTDKADTAGKADKAAIAGKTMRVDPESLQPHAAPSHTTPLAPEVLQVSSDGVEVSSDGAHQLSEEEEEVAFVKAAVIECLNTHYVTPRWDQIAVTPCHDISDATHDMSDANHLASVSSLSSFSNKSNHPLSKENRQEISSFNPTNLPHRCHPLYLHPTGYRTGEDRLCNTS